VRARHVEPARDELLGDELLVGSVEVGVEEAHRDRVHALRHGRDGRRVEGLDLATPPVEPPPDLDPQLALHQRAGPVGHRVVQRRPDLARDLDHVFEPVRRDERDPSASSLEQGVGRDRRAVGE